MHVRLARLRAIWPEAALVAAGVLLRVLLALRYDPRWGYDSEGHISNVEWYRDHWSLPTLEHNRAAYHPPLFYLAGALLLRVLGHGQAPLLGGGRPGAVQPALEAMETLQSLSLLAAGLRLALAAVVLRLLLPDHRGQRLLALGLLAFLPVAVHVDLMVSNEAMVILWATAAMLAMFLLARRPRSEAQLPVAAALGVALGLAMLSKLSSSVLCAAAAMTAVLDVLWRKGAPLGARLLPWGMAGALAIALSGWFYVRNMAVHGRAAPTNFDHPGWDRDQYLATGKHTKGYLQRRSPSYALGWDARIFERPFFPTASDAQGAFFAPVAVASTFVDYYNYGLARDPGAGQLSDDLQVNGWRMRPAAMSAARLSMVGGCVIALVCVAAFFGVARRAWFQRDAARLGLLLVPLLTVVGQLHFAWKYPADNEGMVKGAYMQIAALPLAALFAIGVGWLWSRRWGKPLAVFPLLSVAATLGYLFVCGAIQWGWRPIVFWP